ncbi:MAG: hypothetical protein R3E51_16160 [Rhizobiaceae bacterium]
MALQIAAHDRVQMADESEVVEHRLGGALRLVGRDPETHAVLVKLLQRFRRRRH